MAAEFKVKDLFDLDKTIASGLFDGVEYPWEILGKIKEFIIALGKTLPSDKFDNPSENVWIAKSASVAPTAFIGVPASSTKRRIRHCAFIRGVRLQEKERRRQLDGT